MLEAVGEGGTMVGFAPGPASSGPKIGQRILKGSAEKVSRIHTRRKYDDLLCYNDSPASCPLLGRAASVGY
jgi:hypothetical protein